jgi:hypothetical protein
VGQASQNASFAPSLAQASGLGDIAQANKVTGIINTIGNLAGNVDWSNLGWGSGGSTGQQTGQSAISNEDFIRGTNQWGGQP